jgi:hypothetical protein
MLRPAPVNPRASRKKYTEKSDIGEVDDDEENDKETELLTQSDPNDFNYEPSAESVPSPNIRLNKRSRFREGNVSWSSEYGKHTLEELDREFLIPGLWRAQIQALEQVRRAVADDLKLDEIIALAKVGPFWSWALLTKVQIRTEGLKPLDALANEFTHAGHFLSKESLYQKKVVRGDLSRLIDEVDSAFYLTPPDGAMFGN